ncbi:SPOR domain-containing protein [Aliiroseovarius sp. M344]|uniref:SPOR domain-containing protein n=1 Tax=Aliiroseovarius sp. M344 TaxID=2867010 RepID=UPI0021AD6375|nr:SPOR domain-containing protein [Aliiroseovarius sp. M344]UWQ15355.1 SPOR domain-containing protein [Aliiroseovarius sp. M344]
MSSKTTLKVAMVLGGALFLSGCDDTKLPAFLKNGNKDAKSASARQGKTTRTGERDVEAPEIFQVAEKGLWDGRPSLGGVWVAHPDAKDPERVLIRNQANGKSVVGALFRREREVPGPRFQVSSDAAEELGMLAGAPAELSVTALRKEEITEAPEEVTEDLEAPSDIEQKSLDDPIAAASAALAKTEAASAKAAPPPKPAAPKAAQASKASALSKPYLQVGIFSVEDNANRVSKELQQAGLTATVKPGSSNGKSFWRVVVGPAATKAEQTAMLKKVSGLGFTDAYAVSN